MFGEVVSMGKKQARIIVLILILCFAGAFILSYGYIKYVNKGKTTPVTPTPAGQTAETDRNAIASVSLATDQKSVVKGETFAVSLSVDTGKTKVEAADFVVTFDSNYLTAKDVKQGSFFGVLPVKTIEKDFVKVSGMANLKGDTIIVPKGKGEVASIIFEALETTNATAININRTDTIVASAGKNILDTEKIIDITIEIK